MKPVFSYTPTLHKTNAIKMHLTSSHVNFDIEINFIDFSPTTDQYSCYEDTNIKHTSVLLKPYDRLINHIPKKTLTRIFH